MPDDLEARLKSHARAFEGLMSLIPAKEYYGKDESITSTQWQKKKKQSTEERQAAKRAKLDPASHKTAQDVLDENARKRKRELDGEADEDRDEQSAAESTDLDLDIEKEKPLEGLKSKTKKQKKSDAKDTDAAADEPDEEVKEGRALTKAEQKAALKREKKKEKLAQKKQKLEARKASQAEFSKGLTAAKDEDEDEDEDDDDDENELEHPDDRIQALDVSGLVEESTAASTTANSHSSTASDDSAASSTTSVPQSAEEKPAKKEKKPLKIDAKSQDEFRARLNAKLEMMRAARKADGPDGRPARNRAELIETRRKKEAERKAAKKVSRQEAKEDEARLKAEEQLARIRGGSGSPSIFPARSPEAERSFNFGKVAWEDGQELEGGLSKFLESRKKKGKSDAKTALEAAQKKQARINSYDETKRKDIEEKELWLNAKKRAQGEKVFDDVSLLKKSLKRQQKQKDKSKQEWKERLTNVQDGKEKRQKRREENLKKRRDEKGQKGKKKGGAKKSGGKKPAKRPGFEGTFKAR